MSMSTARKHWENQLSSLDHNNPDHLPAIKELTNWINTYNNSYDENQEYFFDKYPQNDDLTILILRGHLLIEKQIRKFVFLNFPNQNAFKKVSFEIHQVIALAEGFCDPDSEEIVALWSCIKKLNKIRNDLSHQIEPKGFNDRISDFVSSSWRFVVIHSGKPNLNEKIHDCIRSLHNKVLYLATKQENSFNLFNDDRKPNKSLKRDK